MANVAWLVNAVTGAPEYSGRMVRQAMSVALGGATAARPLGARSGIRPGTPATTVALPTATSYVIHPHAGVLDTQASAIAGPYWYVVGSDGADETGTVNAAHGTWPRKDILWVRIDDPSEAGTDPPRIVTGYTAGVAATPGTQVPPATPARSMRLATISVPQSGGGAPTIVFDAPPLAAAGGIVTCRTIAERDALTASATAENPIWVDLLTTGLLYRSVGGAWRGEMARFKGIVAPSTGVSTGTYWPFGGIAGFDVAEDNLSAWNAGTSRWVAPTAGTYLITAQICTSASVPGQYIGIAVNGAYVAASPVLVAAVAGGGQFTCYLRLAAGDGVSIAAALTYTTTNTLATGSNFLQIVQVAF